MLDHSLAFGWAPWSQIFQKLRQPFQNIPHVHPQEVFRSIGKHLQLSLSVDDCPMSSCLQPSGATTFGQSWVRPFRSEKRWGKPGVNTAFGSWKLLKLESKVQVMDRFCDGRIFWDQVMEIWSTAATLASDIEAIMDTLGPKSLNGLQQKHDYQPSWDSKWAGHQISEMV
jgi:hypothetical protein